MDRNWNEQLLSFLAKSPTAFHACHNLALRLTEEGYTELREQDAWDLKNGGKYERSFTFEGEEADVYMICR